MRNQQPHLNPADKYVLTIEESAVYFNIGIVKLRTLINQNPDADWIIRSGSWVRIKRKKFEELIDKTDCI